MNESRQPCAIECHGEDETIAGLVERAFQFRGDVTVETDDGRSVTGYLFNRDARAGEPFVQLFETASGQEVRLPYRIITQLRFTGRDAASVSAQRFEDFQQRQAEPPQVGTGGYPQGD